MWRKSTTEPKPLCKVESKTEKMKSKNSGTRWVPLHLYTLHVLCENLVDLWGKKYLETNVIAILQWQRCFYYLSVLMIHAFTLPADQQDPQQQQPNRTGEPSPPADRDTNPEADDAGGSGHREELAGFPAGASGAAAEERSGRTEWRASHQHERPRGSR